MHAEREHHAASPDDRLDDATARRLARLGDRTVSPAALARLEQGVRGALAREHADAPTVTRAGAGDAPAARTSGHGRPMRWWTPVAGLAAALAITVSLAIVMTAGSPRAAAAVMELSRLHEDILAGRLQVHPVESIDQANRRLTGLDERAPALPAYLAGASVQSCCLVHVQGELVAAALLRHQDVPITLVVAQAPDFAHPMGDVFEIDGRTFFGHELNGVRMMMANLDDRWLCVMGDLPYPALAELAAQLRF